MRAVLASLIDDWIRFRFRDTIALVLIFFGFYVLAHWADQMVRGEAKGLIGAGLIMLDPRAMLRGPGPNGNGSVTTTVSEKTNATIVAPAPAAVLQTSATGAVPAGWPGKPAA